MAKILVTIGALIALMLCAAFIVPYFIDWNAYKGFIETRSREATGQPVLIDGDIAIRLLPQPVVRAEKVRVGAQTEKNHPPLMQAEAFEAAFSIPAMLRGLWEITHVNLVNPVLHVERGGNRLDVKPQLALEQGGKVALDNMTISNGTVILKDERRGIDAVVPSIEAKFQATSLTGPYRLIGTLGAAGRKFSLATGRLGEDGNLRLTSQLDLALGELRLTGQADDLFGTPRFDGRVKLSGRPGPQLRYLVESPVQWDGSLLSLPNLKSTIESHGGQARFEGKLNVDWSARPVFNGQMQARRVDFDALTGNDDKAPFDPLLLARALSGHQSGLLPKIAGGKLKLEIRNGVAAGETFSGLKTLLEFEGGHLSGLTGNAALPGRSTLFVDGRFSAPDGQDQFKGQYSLKTGDLKKLLNWSGFEAALAGRAKAVELKLGGDLWLGAQRARFDAAGTIDKQKVSGQFDYDENLNALAVVLEGKKLDLAGFTTVSGASLPAKAGAEALWLKALVRPSLWARRFPALGRGTRDIRLRADELRCEAGQVRQFEARLRFNNGDLAINRLKFASDDGLSVSMTGNVSNFTTAPESFLKMDLDMAETAARFERLFSQCRANRPSYAAFLSRIAPNLDIGITFTAHEGGKRMKFKAVGKGAFGRGSGTFDYAFEGEPEHVAEGRSVLHLAAAHNEAAVLLDQIGLPGAGGGWSAGAGRLELKVDGNPNQLMGLEGRLVVPDGEASLKANLEGGKVLGLADGRLELALARLDGLLGRFGFAGRQIPQTTPLKLKSAFQIHGARLTIDSLSGMAGGAAFSGHGEMAPKGDIRHTRLSLKPERLDLPLFLLGLADLNTAPDANGQWPAYAIALPKLGGHEFMFEVETPELKLGEQVSLREASLQARVNAGEMEVEQLTGDVFGGKLLASASLTRRPGNIMQAQTGIVLQDAKLEELVRGADGRTALSGRISLELDGEGRGRSLAGIISSLRGEGKITLDDGRVMTPDLTATALISEQAEQAADVEKALKTAIGWRGTPFVTEPLTLKLLLGVAGLERAGFSTGNGPGSLSLYADFSTLRLDGSWRFPLAGLEGGAALVVTHKGPFSKLKRRTNIADIRRYLTRKRILGGGAAPGKSPRSEPSPPETPPAPSGLINQTVKDLPGLAGP